MLIGVPTEIKAQEFRVGMTPAGVRELKTVGHQILVQSGAGAQIGLTDDFYRAAGAAVVDALKQLFNNADVIIKIKHPQPH